MTGEPREPLIGRGRTDEAAPDRADDGGPAADGPGHRPIPRPGLEPAGRLAAAWTPARLRLGLGIALVAVLGGAWFALSSRATPTSVGVPPATSTTVAATSAPTTTRPRAVPVPSWVPRALASTCHARTTTDPTALIVVDCNPGRGVTALQYRELRSATALDAAYRGRRPAERGGAGASRCARGRNEERAWSAPITPSTAAGRYRCTRPHGNARIVWTDDATRVLAVATRADGDLRSLYTWWTTVPGPVEDSAFGD